MWEILEVSILVLRQLPSCARLGRPRAAVPTRAKARSTAADRSVRLHEQF